MAATFLSGGGNYGQCSKLSGRSFLMDCSTMITSPLLSTARVLLAIAVMISCHGCDYIHAAINDRLRDAARAGDARGVYLSLLAGADVSARDTSGSSMLHIAVAGNFEPVIDVLLAKGANVEAKDPKGRTPLY